MGAEAAPRNFTCVFCSKSFNRNDVLRRHWTTCKVRLAKSLDIPSVPSQTRGRKLRACDRCSRMKRACTSTNPCEPCAQHNRKCTYSRMVPAAASARSSRSDDTESRTQEILNEPVLPTTTTTSWSPIAQTITDGFEASEVEYMYSPDDTTTVISIGPSLDQVILHPEPPNHSIPPVSQSPINLFSSPVATCGPEQYNDVAWALAREFTLAKSFIRRPTELNIEALKELPFLVKFTRTSGFVDSFECGSREQRLSIAREILKPEPAIVRHKCPEVDPISSLWTMESGQGSLFDFPFFPTDIQFRDMPPTSRPALLTDDGTGLGASLDDHDAWFNENILPDLKDSPFHISPTSDADVASIGSVEEEDPSSPLAQKTREIISELRSIATTKPRGSRLTITWTPQIEALCRSFFKPSSVRKFLALYWSCWNPNFSAIHKPTFDPCKARACLTASMVLVGACLSPDEGDQALARVWFDIVEEMVFTDEIHSQGDLSAAWRDESRQADRAVQLEVLQASFCSSVYQTWEGDRDSKRRVRNLRYNSLICLAHDIGFEMATLRGVDSSNIASFDWVEFVLRESFIRLLNFITDLDSAFALFYRYPPRLSPSELVYDLCTPETCFQAETAEECFSALRNWRAALMPFENVSVAAAVSILCSQEEPGEMERIFSRCSVLNMFTIVSTMYCMAFRLETSILHTDERILIQRGLQRWIRLWPSPVRDAELMGMQTDHDLRRQSHWKKIGFIRYAPEYWLITYLTMEKIRRRDMRRAGVGGRSVLNLEGGRCEDMEMQHLTALISEFQGMNLMSVIA